MTRLDFLALCNHHNIDVNVALENDELRELLKTRATYKTIEKFLREEF
jgi:hypothetical protein